MTLKFTAGERDPYRNLVCFVGLQVMLKTGGEIELNSMRMLVLL